jgi:hypothetical protein
MRGRLGRLVRVERFMKEPVDSSLGQASPSNFPELLTFMVNSMCLSSRLNDRHRDKPEGVLLSDLPRA